MFSHIIFELWQHEGQVETKKLQQIFNLTMLEL
jgi:hypothetical protein